jgi:hypothetical protein
MVSVPAPALRPPTSWSTGTRLAAVATIVLADALQLASHLIEPTNNDELDRLEWIAANEGQANVAKSLDLLVLPLLFGTVFVYVALARDRSRRLAYVGGLLLGCGFVGLSAVEGFETLEFMLVEDGRFDLRPLADVVENTSSGPGIVMILLFIVPAFFGLLILLVALWRSGAVPRAAVLLLASAFIVDLVLNESLGAVPHWIPHAISLVAVCWIGFFILRAGRPMAAHQRAEAQRP